MSFGLGKRLMRESTRSTMNTDHERPKTTGGDALARVLERLDALVNWERRDRDARMRRGLEPIRDVLARLGDPHRRWRAVHVAGTKGKGTTSSLVATALARGGVRVGLYTSPHVDRIHERIRVDGRDVEDGVLASVLERALDAREAAVHERTIGSEATWFDVITSAAFVAFAEARIEWGVIECGLGGRLDSTNAIDGEVCVITSIDLEHTAVLGSTRAEIAREKAGILKRGSTLVTGVWTDERAKKPARAEDDAEAVICATADDVGCRIVHPARLAPTMLGRDVDLARLVLDELGRRGVRARDGKTFSAASLGVAEIEAARLPARMEMRRSGTTRVVIDAAHVASSVKLVLDELAADSTLHGLPVAVLALGRDKDVPAILKTLAGRVDRLVCTTVATGPLAGAENLANAAERAGIRAETASIPSRALARALDLAQPEGWVLAIGSFYLAGALRPHLDPDPSADWKTPRC